MPEFNLLDLSFFGQCELRQIAGGAIPGSTAFIGFRLLVMYRYNSFRAESNLLSCVVHLLTVLENSVVKNEVPVPMF